MDLALVRLPDDSFELKDLWRSAGCVLSAIFRKAHHLAPVVDSIGLRIIAPSQRWER